MFKETNKYFLRTRTRTHTPTRIRMRTRNCISFKHTDHARGERGGGGWGCPCRLCPTCEERLRRAPLLTVLGTHRISRSFPLPPQRMLARPPDPTPHAYIALCFNHEANRGPLPAPALRAPILHARVPAHSLPVPPSALACGACMRRMLVAGGYAVIVVSSCRGTWGGRLRVMQV